MQKSFQRHWYLTDALRPNSSRIDGKVYLIDRIPKY